jgi:hypothetical protein
MGLHSNSLTFVRAQRPTSHTHSLCKHTTHCARLCSSAIERTRSETSCDPFLGHFSFSPPHSPFAPYSHFSLFSYIPHTSPPQTTISLPKNTFHSPLFHLCPHSGHQHHHCASAGPVFTPISPFSLPSHKTHFHHFFYFFCPIFKDPKAQSIAMDCVFSILCWFLLFLLGVGLDFKWVLKPFFLMVPTKCLTEFPNQFPACLEAKFLLLDPLRPKPW